MKPLPRSLLAVARSGRGLVTAEDLTRHGVVGRARSAALDSGILVPVHRGVYRLGGQEESFEQRCRAACLAAPSAAISGPTAGRLWGLRKVNTEEVHILARNAISLSGVTAHRTDLLGKFDIVEQGGLRLLQPGRLLCDLASHVDEQALESIVEQMIDRKMLSIQSARAAARRFVAPGRPGSVRLGRVLDSRADWLKPADSDLELRLWRALKANGLELQRQVPVHLDSGRTVHVDLADPQTRFAIEVDHATWHSGRLDAQADKRRDRELTRVGWTISRVTDREVSTQLDATVGQLLAIAARLGASVVNSRKSA